MLQCRGHRVCLLLTLYTQACSVSQGILSRGQMHGHWQSACYAKDVLPPVPAAVLLYQRPGLTVLPVLRPGAHYTLTSTLVHSLLH